MKRTYARLSGIAHDRSVTGKDREFLYLLRRGLILSLLEKALLNEKQCADAIDLLDRKYGIHGGCSH